MKKTLAFLFAILILGLILRLINLTILPVFADEAIYIRWSQVMGAEPTLRFLPLSDGKQPLFMWILMFLVRRFDDPLFVGRLLSVISGAGTLIGVFVVSVYLFKSRVAALISAFFVAISPFMVFFDRLALVDSLLAMFGVWCLVFAVAAAKTLRLDFAMLAGFALGGALLTKSPAVFFVILLPTTALLVPKFKPRYILKFSLLTLSSYLIAFGMYNILRLGPNFQLVGSRNADYIFGLNHIFQNFSNPLVGHLGDVMDWFNRMGPQILVILGILGFLVNFKKFKRELLVVSLWFLAPILVQAEYAKVFTARYVVFTIPFLGLIAGTVFITFTKKTKLVRELLVLGVFVFAIQSVVFDYHLLTKPEFANLPTNERSGYLEEWTAGTGIREVSQYFKSLTTNHQSPIVVGTEGYFGTLPDGLQMYLDGVPNVTVIGVGLDLKEIPQSLAESKAAGNRTYLLINNSRLDAEPEKLGLTRIASYPKALRTPGTRLYNLNGPQEVLYLFEL